MNIEDIFPEGKWMSEDEFLIQCPICGDHFDHNHCYVNVRKKRFFCHYEGCKGHINKILEYENVELEPREKVIQKDVEEIDFSQFPKVTGEDGYNDKLALAYLTKRGFDENDIDRYDIRYAPSGRFFGRILLPIYEDSRLVCFTGRSFLNFIEPKYLFPKKKQTVLTISESIFGYDRVQPWGRRNIYLTEGVFDAMAVDKKLGEIRDICCLGLALLSKHMSKGQMYKLLALQEGVWFWVMFDADAHLEAVQVVKQLSRWGREAFFVPLEEGDPASATRIELTDALGFSEQYSEELESRVILEGRKV